MQLDSSYVDILVNIFEGTERININRLCQYQVHEISKVLNHVPRSYQKIALTKPPPMAAPAPNPTPPAAEWAIVLPYFPNLFFFSA